MQIFVLSPYADTMFEPAQRQALAAAGELVPVTTLDGWDALKTSFASADEKVIAIDPRFCNWVVPNDVLDAARSTIALCLQTTSFSWVDVAYAQRCQIAVTNNRDFSTIAVAEWATMMVLLVARRVPIITSAGPRPQFIAMHRGLELRSRTAGIIGLGQIGAALAANMAGLGMDVQYWSKSTVNSSYRKVSLDHLMETSDVVLPALAKNDQTRTLITDALLRSMKKTAIFVSIVHDIYSHDVLVDLVTRGEIFGYAFEQDGATMEAGNIWVGPPMAWFTAESVARNTEGWIAAIINATARQFPTRVN